MNGIKTHKDTIHQQIAACEGRPSRTMLSRIVSSEKLTIWIRQPMLSEITRVAPRSIKQS